MRVATCSGRALISSPLNIVMRAGHRASQGGIEMKASRRTFLAGASAIGAAAYLRKYGIRGARANQPVRIGGQGALSGAHADYGRQMRMGATLAIEEINASGGILGRQVELNFVDEELRPDVATRNA